MSLEVTILGCGSSGGVPRIGNDWGACDPNDPKNRRRRCSIVVRRRGPKGNTVVLVDTSPDLREQALEAGLTTLDAVVYTHDHADHTHGVDDLRAFALRMKRRVPVYMDDTVRKTMFARFGYCFQTPEGSSYPPILDAREITPNDTFTVKGPGGAIEIEPIPVNHGDIDALCLRFGSLAYMPDVKRVPDAARARLQGLDLLILDALRDKTHPSHFNVENALQFVQEMRPRHTVLTDLHVDLDHGVLSAKTPESVSVAYDGLTLTTTV